MNYFVYKDGKGVSIRLDDLKLIEEFLHDAHQAIKSDVWRDDKLDRVRDLCNFHIDLKEAYDQIKKEIAEEAAKEEKKEYTFYPNDEKEYSEEYTEDNNDSC